MNRAEIARQIQLVRDERQAVGFILFSAHTIMQDADGIDETLAKVCGPASAGRPAAGPHTSER
ncbi:MAG TPA: hypothetical protein VJ853_05480 [Thermoanaerobaculia bacterium]|nr:hypothetical protein [Thermoanaerobaculia bacterium]